MPELPEVETSRRGIEPYLVGHSIQYAVVRNARLRWPVSEQILTLSDRPVLSVQRRAKYLLIELENGWIIVHRACRAACACCARKTKMKPANTTTSIW